MGQKGSALLKDSINDITLLKLKRRYAEIGQFAAADPGGLPSIRMDAAERRKCYLYSNITPITDILVREAAGFEDYATGVGASDFRPIEIGESWGANVETGWLKLKFTIPESFAGKPAAAILDLGVEGLAYIDGVPHQGIDRHHRDILLSESAEAGQKYEFVIEGRPSWFWLGDKKAAILARAEIVTINREVERYWYALGFLIALAETLREGSVRRAKLIYGLNESVKEFRFVSSDMEAVRASAVRAYEVLKPLLDKKSDASSIQVTACGHSHIDTAWLWPYAETMRKCSRTFSTVCRMMEQYPDYHFSQSQPQLYEFAKERYPELYKQIKKRVEEGRWEAIGAMWVEPDTNVPSGESLVRQCLLGKRFFMREFGIETDTLWLPDVFGYSAALPQILKKAGVDYFTTVKLGWNQFNKIPYSSFWWQGIDGSKVLTHFPPNLDYNSEVTPGHIKRSQDNYPEKDRSEHALMQFGHGDGGGGPARNHLEHLALAKDLEGLPRCVQRQGKDFFADLAKEAHAFPTWRGELYFERHRGTYTTQSRTKMNNRKCEFLLRDAEMLSSVAMVMGKDYPQVELNAAWRLLLKNQFHDVIPGSSVTEVYEDAEQDYAEIRMIAGAALDSAALHIADSIDTSGKGKAVVVFNTLGLPRVSVASIELPDDKEYIILDPEGEVVESQLSEDGTKILFTAIAPDCGYITYRLVEKVDVEEGILGGVFDIDGEEDFDDTEDECECGCGHNHHHEREGLLQATTSCLENDFFRIELDDDALITSIWDKTAEREVIPDGARANMLQLLEDKPLDWEAWDIDCFVDEKCEELTAADSIEIAEEGLVQASVRIVRSFGDSKLEQRIVIYQDVARIDFVTDVDWQERQQMLKVAFPVDINSPTARYEIQFGNVERPTHSSTSWDYAKFEVCGHKWADLSEGSYGVSLLNDSKYGHDIKENVMRLTLLRGPIDPDPVADIGHQSFTYSLFPHDGTYSEAGVVWMGLDLNSPLRAILTDAHEGRLPTDGSWFSLDSENVVIDTIKKAEDDGSLIIRLYEAHNERGPVTLNTGVTIKEATERDLMERKIGEFESDEQSVTFDIVPFEIKTVKVSY